MQHPFKLRNYKWSPVCSLAVIEYSSDQQRLWSDCAYAQADLRHCWSHIPHCWKSHALAHFSYEILFISLLTSKDGQVSTCVESAFQFIDDHHYHVFCIYFAKVICVHFIVACGKVISVHYIIYSKWPNSLLSECVSFWFWFTPLDSLFR